MHAIPLAALALCLLTGPSAADSPQGAKDPVYKPGDGVSAPVLVKEVKPQYTPEAMRANLVGAVMLECVVGTDGTVGEVKVTRSLDSGLDREAVKAARLWTFKPGIKDGKPVPVLIALELTFTLRDKAAKPPVPGRSPAAGVVTADAQKTAAGPVYKTGEGVVVPVVVKEVKPQYTARAKDARVQGVVELACVVETDGRVGDVKVARSLDEDLDLEAVKAARQWRFEPGTKDGKAVRVQITLEMTFTLK